MAEKIKQIPIIKAKAEKKMSVRVIAAQILLQVLQQGKSLSTSLSEMQGKVNSQDIPLLKEMCFGVCRVLPRLELILSIMLNKPLKGKTKVIHTLLLVGLYQILYTRIPAHAVANEVVNGVKILKLESFHGLVNGIIRRFLREKQTIMARIDQNWLPLHPDWLVRKLKKSYSNWRDIIDANNQKPPMWLRVNQQHCTAEQYQQLLTSMEAQSWVADENHFALCLERPRAVNDLPHFGEGWVSVQDLNAQWSALLLEPKDGELILDACSAPGGKTMHILEKAPQAKVVALDIDEHRLDRVRENLQRMNQYAEVVCADASHPESWRVDFPLFDRILLDAPCSATGVIRRHPDIKWLRQETDIPKLVELQRNILNACWKQLKVNGILLYVTCSLLAEENYLQIQSFLHDNANAKLVKLPFSTQQPNDIGMQFFPKCTGGDGFYYAKLIKLP